ncbi:conserved hypothetical protein [Dehalogenimonas lykanthroporepellens BL-DC-9]|nr:conserved hypothetical protein [Dehalogenimonas lykanthroporepellens BL-DC-9]
MKRRFLLTLLSVLALTGLALAGCNGNEPDTEQTGTLEFYANGEAFVREGFVSRDGWAISFDHVYVTLADITAYQTDPPYDAHDGNAISAKVTRSLSQTYTVDLAEGGADADPILVGKLTGAPAGAYNALSWKLAKADGGPADGYSVVMIGTAEKDGQTVEFTINIDAECRYSGGEFVGDVRKGILSAGGTADLEMTFHFDHLFGDAELAADDELNIGAPGFEFFLNYADGTPVAIDMAEVHLGHVGEGHCHTECG